MTAIQILHNPRCSKSRQTLALLEEKGIEPEIIKYLETPPSETELKVILTKLNMSARDLLRKGEEAYKTLNLKDTNLDDDDLIKAMVKQPKLIERPIVINQDKARLGRPPESVLDIL
ncbi:arsenate reductase (glutaredoxin) [Methylophaga thiooxydans]|uniref:Arsenate reductase n=1 Tax=Methylophaga thiooxydans DMS010 TaxID=637616 RepID=C0N3Z3_9GAMM|nr:arsenate reductase (glutaredoxin) [Methylophaga thiooxydans]EEF80471.1 arsenate reductase [Methylophaga thiooxydans DMS010]